jgi:hypothetical protein
MDFRQRFEVEGEYTIVNGRIVKTLDHVKEMIYIDDDGNIHIYLNEYEESLAFCISNKLEEYLQLPCEERTGTYLTECTCGSDDGVCFPFPTLQKRIDNYIVSNLVSYSEDEFVRIFAEMFRILETLNGVACSIIPGASTTKRA